MKRIKFPISLKIALMVIVLVVITTAFTSYYRIVKDEAVQKEMLHTQMKNLAHIVAQIRHTQPVSELHVDWLLWQDFIDRIMQYYDNIIYIAIFNHDGDIKAFTLNDDIVNIRDDTGNIISDINPPILVNAIEKDAAYIQGGANIINIRFETEYIQQYGRVSFCYSEKMINDMLYESKIRAILLSVNIIILGIIISLFLSRRITRSIDVLMGAIQEIAKGKFPDKIKVYTNDEIATLSENFNEMNQSLYFKNIIENFSYELSKKNSINDIIKLSVHVFNKIDIIEDAGLLLIEDEQNLKYYGRDSQLINYKIDLPVIKLKNLKNGIINEKDLNGIIEQIPILSIFIKGYLIKITTQAKMYGFILLRIKPGNEISAKEQELFNSITIRLSFAIENFLLNQKIVEQEVYKRELEIASKVQNRLLPDNIPSNDIYDIASTIITAKDVGGDYYDFFKYEDKLFVMISDVSGKGTSASFYMALLKGLLLGILNKDSDLLDIVYKINNFIYENTPKDIFISLIFGIICEKSNTFSFIRAGHCPLLYYSQKDEQVFEMKPKGVALGAIKDISESFDIMNIELLKGDFLLMYTDGVSEAMNKNLQEYGDMKLKERVYKSRDKSIDLIIKDILYEIWDFRQDFPQNDDIALLGIKLK